MACPIIARMLQKGPRWDFADWLRKLGLKLRHRSDPMVRSDLVANVFRIGTVPELWVVEAVATNHAIETVQFSGPMAKERAIKYAREKYADFCVSAGDPFHRGRPDMSDE